MSSNGDERKALLDAAVKTAYHDHGYVDDDGEPDKKKLADVLVGPIVKAEAHATTERDQVHILRENLMGIGFPKVPGRDEWAEQNDPELACDTWNRLDGDVWRVLDQNPSGLVQQKLNGDHAVVLVRRSATKAHAADVYVTRNLQCLLADVIGPRNDAAARLATQSSHMTVLLMDRVPEHAKKFNKALLGGLTTATGQAKAISEAKLAVIAAGDDDDE